MFSQNEGQRLASCDFLLARQQSGRQHQNFLLKIVTYDKQNIDQSRKHDTEKWITLP